MDSSDRPAPEQGDSPEHEHAATGALWDAVPDVAQAGPETPEDAMEAQRYRRYVTGRLYEVWVESPFARNPRYQGEPAAPVLRERVCADPGDLPDGGDREPAFVSRDEWDALQRAEDRAALADELRAEMAAQVTQPAVPGADLIPLADVADALGVTLGSLKRRLRTAEVPTARLSSRDYRVRADDLAAWIEGTMVDDASTRAKIDACRAAIGLPPSKRPGDPRPDDSTDDEDAAEARAALRRRIDGL